MDVGKRIDELRKSKGLTQEELAAHCGLNTRTIQRIEAGDVTPRLSTLKLLSEILGEELMPRNRQEQRFWLVLLHLSSAIPLVVIAVLIWVWKQYDFPEMEPHAKTVINFQISMMMALFAAGFLVFIVIGIPILIGLGLYIFFVSIINAIRVSMGLDFRYPLTIRFIQ